MNKPAAIIVLVLLAAIIGVPLALRPQRDVVAHDADAPRLVILTPHNEQTRYELERGFNRHRVAQGKPAVIFDWRTTGGTSDLRRQVIAELKAEDERAARENRPPRSIGYDLFFGGGPEHDILAAAGATVPITLPPGMLEEVFPARFIGSEPLYREDMRWVGTVLASFGIVYNRDLLAMLDLPEPTTWTDLADERYLHMLALADPGHSGSIKATYDAVLRRYGWTEGWAILRRLYANSRYFVISASKVPIDVSAGEAAAGMCIDFYGRFQAGAIRDAATGASRVGYVDPAYVTAITADPISIIRDAPHRDVADEFIIWLLSVEGQTLWQKRIGTPGGPERFELRRLPVRRDVYTPEHMQHWADQVFPFDIARPFPPGTPSYFTLLSPVTQAMAIDIHSDLVAAWSAIAEHPDHPRRAEMLRLFDAMPPELTLTWPDDDLAANWQAILEHSDHPRHTEVTETLATFRTGVMNTLADADQQLAARLRWTKFFRDNYERIITIAKQ